MAAGVLGALTTALPYISAAWQVGSQYLTKPKKEDYVPTGSMYQRYLAHLKSKTAESTVYHQRMRPALRQIGQQTQRGQRQVGYQVAQQKPGGGVEAQMRMGINRQALEAIGIAHEEASVAQERVNVQTGEQLMRIGIQEEQALQRYQSAKQQWTKNMFSTAVSSGLSLASIAAKNKTAESGIIADAEKTIAKSDEAIRTDYNALPESFRKENPFETYLQDVRDRATEITTKLVEPTKDDIEYRKGSLKAAREHRKQFEKGTEDWETADKRVQSSKGKLKTARSDYGEAKKTYREDADKYVTTHKESTGGLAPFAGTTAQISAAHSAQIGERIKSEEGFEKDEQLEAELKQSAAETDEIIQKVNAGDTNFDELEALHFDYMTVADRNKYYTAKRDAIKKTLPDPNKPLQTEFINALIGGKMKEITNTANQIYVMPGVPNEYKYSTFKTVRAEQDRQIAIKERELNAASKEKKEALTQEIKELRAEADKHSFILLLGAESGIYSKFKEGTNEAGKLYSVVGGEAISRAGETIKKVKFLNGPGMGSNIAIGLKRDVITWAKSIKFDNPTLGLLFSNISMGDIDADMKLGEVPVNVSVQDNKSLALIKEWLGRIDALYTQIPYDDTPEMVKGTYAE